MWQILQYLLRKYIDFFILLIVIVKSFVNFPKIFVVVMRRFKVVDKSTTLKFIPRFLANFGKASIESVKNDLISC